MASVIYATTPDLARVNCCGHNSALYMRQRFRRFHAIWKQEECCDRPTGSESTVMTTVSPGSSATMFVSLPRCQSNDCTKLTHRPASSSRLQRRSRTATSARQVLCPRQACIGALAQAHVILGQVVSCGEPRVATMTNPHYLTSEERDATYLMLSNHPAGSYI